MEKEQIDKLMRKIREKRHFKFMSDPNIKLDPSISTLELSHSRRVKQDISHEILQEAAFSNPVMIKGLLKGKRNTLLPTYSARPLEFRSRFDVGQSRFANDNTSIEEERDI